MATLAGRRYPTVAWAFCVSGLAEPTLVRTAYDPDHDVRLCLCLLVDDAHRARLERLCHEGVTKLLPRQWFCYTDDVVFCRLLVFWAKLDTVPDYEGPDLGCAFTASLGASCLISRRR